MGPGSNERRECVESKAEASWKRKNQLNGFKVKTTAKLQRAITNEKLKIVCKYYANYAVNRAAPRHPQSLDTPCHGTTDRKA